MMMMMMNSQGSLTGDIAAPRLDYNYYKPCGLCLSKQTQYSSPDVAPA